MAHRVLRSGGRLGLSPVTGSRAKGYATHADFSVTQASGVKVAATETPGKATGAISLVVKAGSRYEPSPGMSHVLKNFVFKSTEKRSALSLVRETELLGGVLTAALSREHLVLTAQFLRGDEAYFAEALGDVLTCSKFSPYEYAEDVVPQVAVEYEQAIRDPVVFAFDVAHQLAFRTGLGNSLFANPHVAVDHADIVAFATSSFAKSSEMAVVADGLQTDSLARLVSDFFVPKSGSAISTAPTVALGDTKYHGGEVRVPATAHGGSDTDIFLLGFKGAGRNSPEYTVLQHLLGGQSTIKWNKGTAPLGQLQTKNTSARAFNLAYGDGGLFGVLVSAPTAQVGDVASKAVQELRKVASGVDAAAVKKAIAQAKFAAAAALEDPAERVEALGAQILDKGKISSLADLYSSLDAVSPSKVSEAAANALKSRPTTVAVGDTHNLPYADTLGL